MKAIDITEKLNFEEKPQLKIKDKVLAVYNDATALLEIVAKVSDKKNMKVQDIKAVCETLFAESEREKLEALHLNLTDYTVVVQAAIELIVGDNSGETQTPATT